MKNILVVDNDSVIRSLLKSFLSLKKYRVECVNTGIDALNFIAKESFDIIITDLKMDDMDGTELIKKIHDSCPNIKLIAMSGDSSFDKLPSDLKSNIPFIHKPFRLQEMERLILDLSVN